MCTHRFGLSAAILLALVLASPGCPGDLTLDDDDAGGGELPFDLDALSCEHDFVNERLGGVHYWLLELGPDGSFEAEFPNSVGDRVIGTLDAGTGVLSATVTFDDGYKIVDELVAGTFTFEPDGDMTAESTVTMTYLDGFVEVQDRQSALTACMRTADYTSTDRRDETVTVSVETTFIGDMTALETVDGDIGGHTEVSFGSVLNEDYSRDDAITHDDLETPPSPDQEVERTMEADGSGHGTFVAVREQERMMIGAWDYHRDGDYEGDWELNDPDAPTNPVAWGHTINHLDGSGSMAYTRFGPGGTEVECTSEWDADGHGSTDCDDGTHEEF